MSWKTSRGFVSSQERIDRIERIPLIVGYQTSGAVVKYAAKEDFPKLASLTEGGFAADFIFIKDNTRRKMLIPGVSKDGVADSSENVDMTSRKHEIFEELSAIQGVLAHGISDGCKSKLNEIEEKNTLVFWYNGNWNIIKKDSTKEEYIPLELAKKVIESGKCDVSGIVNKLPKEKLKDTDYESVSSREMSKLMSMENELYSKWQFNGVLHIMLNTEMSDGPYQLKRREGNIYITFYPKYKNGNNSKDEYVPVQGISNDAMGSYFTAIKEGFEKWNVVDSKKSEGELKGLGDYTINLIVKIDDVNRERKNTSIIDVINTYDSDSSIEQVSNVANSQWRINNVGKLTMYSFPNNSDAENRYDREQYCYIAAHEFGHLLGIGDAYKKNDDDTPKIRPTGEVPEDDLMRGGRNITYNDIEMVFLAALTNREQTFEDSEAITEGK